MGKKEKKRGLMDEVKKMPNQELQTQLETEVKKRKVAEVKAAALQVTVEKLDKQLDELKKAKWQIPKSKRTDTKGAFRRVIIPDTHGSKADPQALGTFLHDLEVLQPAEIIMLGDHLDCGGFLAQHHTWGYVAETSQTFEEDVDATNQLLDQIQKICPNARIDYLEGNHEARVEKFCVTQALRNGTDAAFLLKHLSPQKLLHLEKRNIPYYQRSAFHDGLKLPGTIKRGPCHFTHGSRTGVHAARSMAVDFGGNVVYGHVHRQDSHVMRTVHAGAVGAWSPGCLCILQPLWNHTQITGWAHGYGVQLVRPDGEFLHINIPIIDGKSFLVALVDKLV